MRKAYLSDLSDAQWAILEPLIPVMKTGRHRQIDMREVFNAIFYLNRTGCQWDMLPHDLPAKSSVYDHFARWRDDGSWQEMMDALRRDVRVAEGRQPNPSAAIIDSQTVKGTEIGGVRGYDGGKKLSGVKRHIIVDTLGLLLVVAVSAASADDGTYASEVLGRLTSEHCTRLETVWGDTRYHNHRLIGWIVETETNYWVEVIGRPEGSVGYVRLPHRWIVERSFAWLGRYRRHSRDYERLSGSSESMIRISSIRRMLRLLRPDVSKRANPFKYRETREIVAG
jgi:putative transposase